MDGRGGERDFIVSQHDGGSVQGKMQVREGMPITARKDRVMLVGPDAAGVNDQH